MFRQDGRVQSGIHSLGSGNWKNGNPPSFFFEFEMWRLNGGKTRKMENRFMQIAPTTKRDINLHDSTFLKDFFLRNIPSWNLSTADRVCPCYIQLQPNVNAGESKHFTGLVMQPKENGIFAIYSPKSRGKASFFLFFFARESNWNELRILRAMALSAPSDSEL